MLASITEWTINLVSTLGYTGVFIAMAIEAASIPLPSEIIMGIAGFLVFKGEMNLFVAGFIGALGNAFGSTTMYVLGSRGGRPAVKKYGKYVHITEEKFERTEAWFKKYGEKMIFFFQLLPIVRTFISFPLGVLKANFIKFRIYTFVGAFLWCTLLAYISFLLGPEWEKLGQYMHQFEIGLVVLAVVAVVGYLFYRMYKRKKTEIET